jgi:hypothetical protein
LLADSCQPMGRHLSANGATAVSQWGGTCQPTRNSVIHIDDKHDLRCGKAQWTTRESATLEHLVPSYALVVAHGCTQALSTKLMPEHLPRQASCRNSIISIGCLQTHFCDFLIVFYAKVVDNAENFRNLFPGNPIVHCLIGLQLIGYQIGR